MSRSFWKIPYFKLNKKKISKQQYLFVYLLNKQIKVHDGKKYIDFVVQSEHLGYRIGEFILTKKFAYHPEMKKANVKKHGNKSDKK